jgi:hypothetical protein
MNHIDKRELDAMGSKRMPCKERKAMYTMIRKYDIIPGTGREVMRQVQIPLRPVLSRMPGLKAYYLVEVADNQVAAISIFETQADAKAAERLAAAWIAQQGSSFFRGSSEVMAGLTSAFIEPADGRVPTQITAEQEELLRGCF